MLGFVKWFSFWSVAPPARGAGGIPTSPLCPPGPPIPPSNGRGIPPDPPCPGRGTSPCVSTDRVRIGHAIWFGPGPATNRVPGRARTLHGPGAGARTAARWPCRSGPLPYTPRINRRPGAGGGISCAEGDSGPPRDGREPSWARPCEASGALFLSNGGSGGGHETCTLWPPPAPFGYFPVWESTSSARRRTKPPTRNKFLAAGRKRAYLSFPVSQRVSPLRRRPIPCGWQGKALPYFFLFYGGFRLCGGDQRAFRSPFGNLRALCSKGVAQKNRFLVEGKGKTFLTSSRFTEGFASAEATKGLSDRPLETFGPFAAKGWRKKQIPCGRQEKSSSLLFPVSQGISHLRVRPGGFPLAPWTPSGMVP